MHSDGPTWQQQFPWWVSGVSGVRKKQRSRKTVLEDTLPGRSLLLPHIILQGFVCLLTIAAGCITPDIKCVILTVSFCQHIRCSPYCMHTNTLTHTKHCLCTRPHGSESTAVLRLNRSHADTDKRQLVLLLLCS